MEPAIVHFTIVPFTLSCKIRGMILTVNRLTSSCAHSLWCSRTTSQVSAVFEKCTTTFKNYLNNINKIEEENYHIASGVNVYWLVASSSCICS